MLNDTRLRGEVNLDGELFGEVTNTGLGRPGINQSFVLFGVEGHNRLSEPEWRPFYQNVEREGMWGRELELLNAPQSTFSNVPLIVDVTVRFEIGFSSKLSMILFSTHIFCGTNPLWVA